MYRLNVFYYYYCTNMLYLYDGQIMKFQVYIKRESKNYY